MSQMIQQKTTVEHEESISHWGLHWMGDNFGYSTLITVIILGALIVFRKKIKSFLGVK